MVLKKVGPQFAVLHHRFPSLKSTGYVLHLSMQIPYQIRILGPWEESNDNGIKQLRVDTATFKGKGLLLSSKK